MIVIVNNEHYKRVYERNHLSSEFKKIQRIVCGVFFGVTTPNRGTGIAIQVNVKHRPCICAPLAAIVCVPVFSTRIYIKSQKKQGYIR